MLLESDYPIDLQVKNGMTAFQIAAFCGNHSILEIMMYYAFSNGGKKNL